jgi:hypothetical protein
MIGIMGLNIGVLCAVLAGVLAGELIKGWLHAQLEVGRLPQRIGIGQHHGELELSYHRMVLTSNSYLGHAKSE